MNGVDTAVLLISHGSSLSYSKNVFEEICEKFKKRTGLDAEVGYMKVEDPDIFQAARILKKRNPDLKRIIALPVFLADGIHTLIDIPMMLGFEPKEIDPRHPDGIYPESHYLHDLKPVNFEGEIILLDSIGPNPKLVDIINKKVEEALNTSNKDDAKTGVLILSHGSRLRYNKEFLMALFEQYENQAKYPSNYGFMELSEPNIPDSANLLIKRDNLERLVVIPVFIAPGMHTKIDIKAILNLIHENEKKNRSKPKNNNIKEIKINKIILEEDPDHAHKYDETVDFEGEILYPDPIGDDDILIEILEDMVNDAL